MAIDPAFVPALKNLSINEFNAQDYPAAEKHLLAAEKLMPEDPAIHLYLGEISYRQQKYQRAAQELGLAHDFVIRSPNASAHLAISYLQTNEPQKALSVLDALTPEHIDPKTQFELALDLDRAGYSERAIPYLKAVHEQFQDSYEIAFDLMIVDLEAKSFPDAIETGKDLIARGHDTSELNNILAQAYEGNAEIPLAVEAYHRAVTLDPNDEDNYLDLASLCINQHSFPAGMKVVETALTMHPKSERLIFMRGLLHAMQDDFEAAESDFKLSESLSPEKNLGYIGLGASYMETGHYAEAIQILRKRLRVRPNDASLLYLLGEDLIRTGAAPESAAYIEAQKSLEKSVELNPNLCLPHISLGTIYLDENRLKEAVAQFEKARSIDPKERSTYSHLAVAYKKQGEQDKAAEVLSVLKGMIAQEHQGALEKMKAATAQSAGQQAGGQQTNPDQPANQPAETAH